ncbi:MAG: site-specific integrase [Candidatus Brocadia sp. WS118]|nr:MAG: site-specific integrase [Candidatus Brocadia sp. WS118]
MFIGDRERGKLNLPKKKVIPTLAAYSKTYLELYKNAKENTRIMKKSITTSLVKYLGDYSLDKITPFVIEKYRLERKEKDSVKDSSINVDVSILGHIFNTAIKAGIWDKNPCKDVRRLKVAQGRDRVLTAKEMDLLSDKLQEKDRLMVFVGILTGMRLGEVLRLKWTDIDFDKGLICFTQGKTGKLVTIPFSSYLAAELFRHKERNPGDKVFEPREITNTVIIRYSEHFSHLFKRFGIGNFTFHNLRHTFASLLQGELGIGAVVVQGMTGHSSLGMLQKYSHTGLDSKRNAIEMLTAHVFRAGEKATIPMVSKTGTA